MAMLMLLLLVTVTGFALLVLADSGVRMWHAFNKLRAGNSRLAVWPASGAMRQTAPARVTTRVSYARQAPRQLRAAA
ncbi:hypothetical protein [Qipengyuania sediminis]|uniref:hypothetical protein n=1 Tax=Qipengyuania sediminis TaxID=1532023 RepID=UPI00105A666B|nr:hypothetical protein [Qipengyuania sediminis]